jgi:hypothetical protein
MELVHGAVAWNERVDTNRDHRITDADMTFGQLLRDSETLRADPNVTERQLRDREHLIKESI